MPRVGKMVCLLALLWMAGCLPVTPASTAAATSPSPPTAAVNDLAFYAFPETIDPSARYLFYLHGKILEDQGIPAYSAEYGEYEYLAILNKLAGKGFTVISELRPASTDSHEYASRVNDQVRDLLSAGVPPENITVVGASKGGGIAIYVSNLVGNPRVNYVILSICSPDTMEEMIRSGVTLTGNVLSIYDEGEQTIGSCQILFYASAGSKLGRTAEVVTTVGTGHGILYHPLDEWIDPVVDWANQPVEQGQ